MTDRALFSDDSSTSSEAGLPPMFSGDSKVALDNQSL